jgi:hypothetical protein
VSPSPELHTTGINNLNYMGPEGQIPPPSEKNRNSFGTSAAQRSLESGWHMRARASEREDGEGLDRADGSPSGGRGRRWPGRRILRNHDARARESDVCEREERESEERRRSARDSGRTSAERRSPSKGRKGGTYRAGAGGRPFGNGEYGSGAPGGIGGEPGPPQPEGR